MAQSAQHLWDDGAERHLPAAGAEKFEKTIIYSFSLENLSQTTQTTFKHCKESSWSDERGGGRGRG